MKCIHARSGSFGDTFMAKPRKRSWNQDEVPMASMSAVPSTGSLNDVKVNRHSSQNESTKLESTTSCDGVDESVIESICEGVGSNLIPTCYAVVGETTTGRLVFDRELFIQLIERFGYDRFHSEVFVDSFESAWDDDGNAPIVMTRSASLMIMDEIPKHDISSKSAKTSSGKSSKKKKRSRRNNNNKRT